MQIDNRKECIFLKKKMEGVILTGSAIKRIKQIMKKDNNILGLRLSVRLSGCAGFKYLIEKVFHIQNENDLIYERDGARLYVPLEFISFIDGTSLSYVKEGLSYSFKFKNPKIKNSCGCGKSFNL